VKLHEELRHIEEDDPVATDVLESLQGLRFCLPVIAIKTAIARSVTKLSGPTACTK
jgi:hypothetical protein